MTVTLPCGVFSPAWMHVEDRTTDLPGYRVQRLMSEYEGFYAVSVSGNWRGVFRIEGELVTDVDYPEDH